VAETISNCSDPKKRIVIVAQSIFGMLKRKRSLRGHVTLAHCIWRGPGRKGGREAGLVGRAWEPWKSWSTSRAPRFEVGTCLFCRTAFDGRFKYLQQFNVVVSVFARSALSTSPSTSSTSSAPDCGGDALGAPHSKACMVSAHAFGSQAVHFNVSTTEHKINMESAFVISAEANLLSILRSPP
jgi:hypothetical protein